MEFWDWLHWQGERQDPVGEIVRRYVRLSNWGRYVDSFDTVLSIMSAFQVPDEHLHAAYAAWDEWTELARQHYRETRTWPKYEPVDDYEKAAREWVCPNRAAALQKWYGAKWKKHCVGWFPQERPGYVYYLKADNGLFKIGRTVSLDSRFKTLSIVVPYELELVKCIRTDDCVELERQHHSIFAEYRIKGEWFDLPEERRPKPEDREESYVELFMPPWDLDITGLTRQNVHERTAAVIRPEWSPIR